jgi:hypothetical protein
MCSGEAPGRTQNRRNLQQAIIAALGVALPSRETQTAIRCSKSTSPDKPVDRKKLQEAAAILLEVSVGDLKDARLDNLIEEIKRGAEVDAEAVADYVNSLVEHFETISCECSKIGDYFRLANQTLASLYLAISCPNPSPIEVKSLALRYVLDARVPVRGPIERYRLAKCKEGWEVTKYPSSLTPRCIPFPARRIRNRLAVLVLDCVFANELRPYRLMELIELLLGGQPSRKDALPPDRKPRFTYQIDEDTSDYPVITLRIGQTVVRLPKRRDVHLLLRALCESPHLKLTGPHCRENLGVTNASEACRLIRNALAKIRSEAGEWLLTNPIRWSERHEPQLRPQGCQPGNSPQ